MADYKDAYGYVDNILRLTSEDRGVTWRWSDKADPFDQCYGPRNGSYHATALARDETLAREVMELQKQVSEIQESLKPNTEGMENPDQTPPPLPGESAEITGLNALVEHLRGRVQELEDENSILEGQFTDLETELQEARDEASDYEDQLSRVTREKEELESALEDIRNALPGW